MGAEWHVSKTKQQNKKPKLQLHHMLASFYVNLTQVYSHVKVENLIEKMVVLGAVRKQAEP